MFYINMISMQKMQIYLYEFTLSLYSIWTPLILPTNDCIVATAWLKCIPVEREIEVL